MSVNPVNANSHLSSPNTAVNPQPQASPGKNSPALPEDTVTLSAAAKGKQAGSFGDVDHDGDSK